MKDQLPSNLNQVHYCRRNFYLQRRFGRNHQSKLSLPQPPEQDIALQPPEQDVSPQPPEQADSPHPPEQPPEHPPEQPARLPPHIKPPPPLKNASAGAAREVKGKEACAQSKHERSHNFKSFFNTGSVPERHPAFQTELYRGSHDQNTTGGLSAKNVVYG